jgi:mono/diheme cytochrome c family protein
MLTLEKGPVAMGGWVVPFALLAISMLHPGTAQAAQDPAGQGLEIFQTWCSPCHTIGGGTLVGPDLAGVGDRRSEEWIVGFVQGSQEFVEAGDSTAVALFEEFNRVMMPDQPFSDDEIRAVIALTRPGVYTSAPVQGQLPEATEEQILLGQALFQGTTRFTKSGPTCNSCHEVTNDAVIGGGILAPELTSAFTKLTGPGLRAIITSPPYPVMQLAYRNKELTEEEVTALVGFLKRADEVQAQHQPRGYGVQLLLTGLLGTGILFGLFSLAWKGRLKESVNQAIYDRQVKST